MYKFKIKINKALMEDDLSFISSNPLTSNFYTEPAKNDFLYVIITTEQICNVKILCVEMINSAIVFDFVGFVYNNDILIEDKVFLLEHSQKIYDLCYKHRMSVIESYSISLIQSIKALSSRIDGASVDIANINDNICFDVLGVVEDICEVIGRPDILDEQIERLTIQ